MIKAQEHQHPGMRNAPQHAGERNSPACTGPLQSSQQQGAFRCRTPGSPGAGRALILAAQLLCLIASGRSVGRPEEKAGIVVDGNTVSVTYGGRIRLAGGRPVLEHGTPVSGPAREKNGIVAFGEGASGVEITTQASGAIVTFFISPHGRQSRAGADFVGLFFDDVHDFREGVALWRYKPWNSWSKPMRVDSIGGLEPWDVQFFYWRHADGVYGAAMPLCGRGYRSTLGRHERMFGCKAACYADGIMRDSIPLMSVGWGEDLYGLCRALYEEGMGRVGLPENTIGRKSYPPAFEYLGSCTWNGSDMGKRLNEKFLYEFAGSYRDSGIPVRWLMIDEGWMDSRDNALRTLRPDTVKFPRGFRPVVKKLLADYGLRDVGIYYDLNAHWNGLDPEGEVGQLLKRDLYSWTQPERPDLPDSPMKTHWFLSPSGEGLHRFFSSWNRYFRQEGFSMIKVDNQSVTERMGAGRFPIMDLSSRLHGEINEAAMTLFDGALINCMDMTSEAYFAFGPTAVARTVEDYFEYSPGEGYDLQKGNAAAHVLQAIYNSLYFSQTVFTDFDMFQSVNPNARLDAMARALSGGPVYLSDRPGKHDAEVLRPLCYADGRLIRTDAPLLPVEECLFQVQDARVFKAFTLSRGSGLVMAMNAADADSVSGFISPDDVHGLKGREFGLVEFGGRSAHLVRKGERLPLRLGRLEGRLFAVVPLVDGAGAVGLLNKYNAPGTVLSSSREGSRLTVHVGEGGTFGAVMRTRPRSATVDGEPAEFTFDDFLLKLPVPGHGGGREHIVALELE